VNGRQSLRQCLRARFNRRFAARWSCLRLRTGQLIPPMGRQEIVEPLIVLGIDPAAEYAATRKCERVHTAAVDHGEFHVPIKWRRCLSVSTPWRVSITAIRPESLIWIICLVITPGRKAERGDSEQTRRRSIGTPNRRQRKRVVQMRKRALIAVMLMATSPASAQVATSPNQQGLLPGQTGELAPTQAATQAPTTGVFCAEEMTATFCNVPTGPNTGGYGTGGGPSATGGGAASGLGAAGRTGGNASSLPPCPGEPPFNELCN
jgi:hypothetical protein